MTKESNREGLRREKKQKEEKKWQRLLWEGLSRHKRKYSFLWPKEDNIGVVMGQVRESLFSDFFLFGKQPIENKSYF